MLYVHKDNRGAVYPTPVTVQNLGVGILQDGFIPAEANHEGVCVQEIPTKERPPGYETSLEVNQRKTMGTLLEGCFPADSNAGHGTLAHGHLLLSLLCWLFGLKWGIPDNSQHHVK